MGRKRNGFLGGGAGAILMGAWGLYSQLTTVRDLPGDAGWVAKMIADPPVYAPWLLFGACVIFLAWVFWRRPENDDGVNGPAQSTHGAGSHAIGSIKTAHFTHTPAAEPAIRIAAASQTVEIMRSIERKYCGSGYLGVLNLLQFHDTFQNNVLIVVGSKLGLGYMEKEAYEEANDFFEGGGTILTTKMENFSEGPMRHLKLPPNEVVYVNFTKQAGEVTKELADLALSPFLPPEVSESVTQLKEVVDAIYKDMIVFLNERFQRQRVRLVAATNDVSVAGGLCNDYLDRTVVALEDAITHLREAIRRSLQNG